MYQNTVYYETCALSYPAVCRYIMDILILSLAPEISKESQLYTEYIALHELLLDIVKMCSYIKPFTSVLYSMRTLLLHPVSLVYYG